MKNSTNFPALTGIRAIAAYLVFFTHVSPFGGKVIYDNQLYFFFRDLNILHIELSLFFVLSGFVVANKYYETSQKKGWRNYFANRFVRIYPLFWGITTLTLLANFFFRLQMNINWKLYLLNISLLKGFFKDLFLSGVGQTWTLTVVEMFYLLVPIFFFCVKKSKWNLIAIPAILLGLGLLLVSVFKNFDFYGFFGSNDFMLQTSLFGRCFEFFVGIALALLLKNKRADSERKIGLTYVGLAIILVHLIVYAYLAELVKDPSRLTLIRVTLNNFTLPLFGISLLFWGLITENTRLNRILGGKAFVLLGQSSYVFYLIHVGIFTAILMKFSSNIVFLFIALNLLAIIGFKLVDEPLTKYLKQKLQV
ncbi:acyltransferase family protein [Pinibacter aurantiacus]|uniref:Acyltransferase n=1 Tax=Pinibacter aurantiacus TaxID=2851599 RepID=A0A9E2W8K6_9BACT|nr:acyltransferase [Pinibacter aurantiacus]MBV4358322.1 acyltransferase [Pinibacter aurantiacus]